MGKSLASNGYKCHLNIPEEANVPQRKGYMVCYTFDQSVINKAIQQLNLLCKLYKLPESFHNGGAAVRLKLERTVIQDLHNIASIDALCQIYRDLGE
jgi:hypothetical protein